MNIAALMAGDLVTNYGSKLINNIVSKVFDKQSDFSSLLNTQNSSPQGIKIEDLNLTKEEEIEINQIREFAMARGLSEIEFEMDGIRLKLNVQSNTLTPNVNTNHA